ncbi:unnamed protein product [Brassicogethes aeneus]|uniref:RNA-dependent RNA polymerase alsuviricetes domain-containing protein n=1 Tax=Brassicogethes aeneus TaxID=1431903 RepID=A0A9P0BG09_BRAAE|nr:unnamed protein product [Brassicogethes aeneus]
MAFSKASAKANTEQEKNTVRSNQGGTHKTTILYCTVADGNTSSVEKLQIVAISRHTEKLYIVSDNCDEAVKLKQKLALDQEFYEHMQTWLTFPNEEVKPFIAEDKIVDLIISEPHPPKDLHLLHESFLPTAAYDDATTSMNLVSSSVVPQNFATGTFNIDGLLVPVNKRGHPTSLTLNYYSISSGIGNHFSGKSPAQVMQVLQARYFNKQPYFELGFKQRALASKMVNLWFAEHVIDDYRRNLFDDAEITKVIAGFFKKVTTQNYQKAFEGNGGSENPDGRSIRFSLKGIFKPKHGTPDIYKAGQGISAWSTDACAMFCLIFRILCRFSIKSEKYHVTTDSYLTEQEFMMNVKAKIMQVPAVAKFATTDGITFDANQNAFTQLIEKMYWGALGVPEDFLEHYYSFRKNYIIISSVAIGFAGTQKTSGEPETLPNNGVVSKIASNFIVRGEGPVALIYKGDDFTKRQLNLAINESNREALNTACALGLRVDIADSTEFCGLMFSAGNLFPSIPRKINKLCAHKFVDYQHFCEYQDSLRNWITISSTLGSQMMIAANAAHYKTSFKEMEFAYDYIDTMKDHSKDKKTTATSTGETADKNNALLAFYKAISGLFTQLAQKEFLFDRSTVLKDVDRLVRGSVKRVLHLPSHVPNCVIHAKVRDGGLGILEMRHAIPQALLRRMDNVEYGGDPVLNATMLTPRIQSIVVRLQKLAGNVPTEQIYRAAITSDPMTTGIQISTEDPASRGWVSDKPTGWTGRDYVRAIQLRANVLPTRGIPSNPEHLRRCRNTGCNAVESLSHVLQQCSASHGERVRRHNDVARKIAAHTRKTWDTEEEPHVRHQDGQLYKPDIVVHKDRNTIVVCDVQVSWEGADGLTTAWERKRGVYQNPKFVEAAARRWPGKTCEFTPLIIGARGTWPRCNEPTERALELTKQLKASEYGPPPIARRQMPPSNSVEFWKERSEHTALFSPHFRGRRLFQVGGHSWLLASAIFSSKYSSGDQPYLRDEFQVINSFGSSPQNQQQQKPSGRVDLPYGSLSWPITWPPTFLYSSPYEADTGVRSFPQRAHKTSRVYRTNRVSRDLSDNFDSFSSGVFVTIMSVVHLNPTSPTVPLNLSSSSSGSSGSEIRGPNRVADHGAPAPATAGAGIDDTTSKVFSSLNDLQEVFAERLNDHIIEGLNFVTTKVSRKAKKDVVISSMVKIFKLLQSDMLNLRKAQKASSNTRLLVKTIGSVLNKIAKAGESVSAPPSPQAEKHWLDSHKYIPVPKPTYDVDSQTVGNSTNDIATQTDIQTIDEEMRAEIVETLEGAKETRNTYALVVEKEGKVFEEVLKDIKENVQGIKNRQDIRAVRKTKDGKLLITIEKDEEALKSLDRAMEGSKQGFKVRTCSDRKAQGTIYVRGMEATTRQEELMEAVKEEMKDPNKIYKTTEDEAISTWLREEGDAGRELPKLFDKDTFTYLAQSFEYQGFDVRRIIKTMISMHRRGLTRADVTVQDAAGNKIYSSRDSLMADVRIMIAIFITRGSDVKKIKAKSTELASRVITSLAEKYSLSLDTRASRTSLGPDIITLPRVAACFPLVVCQAYNQGIGKTLYSLKDLGLTDNSSKAILTTSITALVPKITEDGVNNIMPLILLCHFLTDNVIHSKKNVTRLEHMLTYLKAEYRSQATPDASRVAAFNEFGYLTAGKKSFLPSLLTASAAALEKIRVVLKIRTSSLPVLEEWMKGIFNCLAHNVLEHMVRTIALQKGNRSFFNQADKLRKKKRSFLFLPKVEWNSLLKNLEVSKKSYSKEIKKHSQFLKRPRAVQVILELLKNKNTTLKICASEILHTIHQCQPLGDFNVDHPISIQGLEGQKGAETKDIVTTKIPGLTRVFHKFLLKNLPEIAPFLRLSE